MPSKYNKLKHCLVAQPTMERPILEAYIGRLAYHMFESAIHRYNAHIASLRSIPCQPGSIWEEDRLYEEGRDYEVKEVRTFTYDPKYGWGCAESCNGDRCDETCTAVYYRPNCPYCKGSGWYKEKPFIAIPIPKEDDRLWYQVKELMLSAMDKGLSPEEWIGLMKGLGYQLTKKTV